MKLALRVCSGEAEKGEDTCAGGLKLKVSAFCCDAGDGLGAMGVCAAGRAVWGTEKVLGAEEGAVLFMG